MIDDYAKELIDSDSERFMWIAKHLTDSIAGIDLHESASKYAEKHGRDEPNYEDYGDAVRDAIDRAEDMTANELWRAEAGKSAAHMLDCSHQWKSINGTERCIKCGGYWIAGTASDRENV